MTRILFGAAISLVCSVALCSADDTVSMVVQKSTGPGLSPDKMYMVEVTCQPTSNPFPKVQSGWFVSHTHTLTHFVFVTPSPPGPSGTAVPIATPLGTSSLIALPFSVDTTSASGPLTTNDTQVNHLNGLCSKRELLTNTSAMYFIGVLNQTHDVGAGRIGAAVDSVSQLVTALAPIVTGSPLAANASSAGVSKSSAPKQPRSPQPRSSA